MFDHHIPIFLFPYQDIYDNITQLLDALFAARQHSIWQDAQHLLNKYLYSKGNVHRERAVHFPTVLTVLHLNVSRTWCGHFFNLLVCRSYRSVAQTRILRGFMRGPIGNDRYYFAKNSVMLKTCVFPLIGQVKTAAPEVSLT